MLTFSLVPISNTFLVKTVLTVTRPHPSKACLVCEKFGIFYEYGIEKQTNQGRFRHKYDKIFVSTPFGERIRNLKTIHNEIN